MGNRWIAGGWLHPKLTLVALMFAHYIVAGRWLKGVANGKSLPSSLKLRVFNEIPVFALVAVVYLVLAKPFCWFMAAAGMGRPLKVTDSMLSICTL